MSERNSPNLSYSKAVDSTPRETVFLFLSRLQVKLRAVFQGSDAHDATSLVADSQLPLADVHELERVLIDPATGRVRSEFNFSEDARKIVEQFPGVEFVGAGNEHVVVRMHETRPDQIIKYQKERARYFETSPLETIEVYHLHKLLHMLLPDSFPDIYATRSGLDVIKSRWMYVEKAKPEQFSEEKRQLQEDVHSISSRIDEQIQELGIQLGFFNTNRVAFDASKRENFIVDTEGKLKYIDRLTIGPQPIRLDFLRLNSVIHSLNNPTLQLKIVRHLLSIIELEVVKYAWIHAISPDSNEFAMLRGDLDNKSWNLVQKYARRAFYGNFKRDDFYFCKENVVQRQPFTLTSGIAIPN